MPQPGMSKGKDNWTDKERVEKAVKDAEASRGQIFTTTGKPINVDFARDMIHSVLVDEEYSSIGTHLDENIINKIRRGEYANFSKLLPRDRLAIEEDS